MNKNVFVVMVVGVIAVAMIMSAIVTSDVFADTKRERTIKVLDKHISAGGEHGEKAEEIKRELTCSSCPHD
jgi:hypothetical protein